jgi:replication factor C small subunit
MTLLEKYYPRNWEDLILPENVKLALENARKTKGYRLLLHGSAGIGKTTSARLMAKDDSLLYLSGSNNLDIETVRSKIMPFATGMSINDKGKTIILDEFENARDNIQDTFKIILDQCRKTNFIFCTNEVEKIISPLKSRCTMFDYDFVNTNLQEHKSNYNKWVVKICKSISQEHGIELTSQGVSLMIKNNFPDFRHILVTLQQIIDSGIKLIDEQAILNFSENSKQLIDLYEIIMNPKIHSDTLYQEVCKYRTIERDTMMSLGEPFFKYLNDKGLYDKTIEAAEIMSKYYDYFHSSMNRFVTFFSCINQLKTLFR